MRLAELFVFALATVPALSKTKTCKKNVCRNATNLPSPAASEATKFCSYFLSLCPETTTITRTAASTRTATATATPSTSTVTLATSTVSASAATTVQSTVTSTFTQLLTTSTSTITATVPFSSTSTTTIFQLSYPTQCAAAGSKKRADHCLDECEKPSQWASLSGSALSTACSCLHLSASTATSYTTTTSDLTVTSTVQPTVTSSVKPLTTLTSTHTIVLPATTITVTSALTTFALTTVTKTTTPIVSTTSTGFFLEVAPTPSGTYGHMIANGPGGALLQFNEFTTQQADLMSLDKNCFLTVASGQFAGYQAYHDEGATLELFYFYNSATTAGNGTDPVPCKIQASTGLLMCAIDGSSKFSLDSNQLCNFGAYSQGQVQLVAVVT